MKDLNTMVFEICLQNIKCGTCPLKPNDRIYLCKKPELHEDAIIQIYDSIFNKLSINSEDIISLFND